MMDVLRGYRDQAIVSSGDDSEDSDKECSDWKRPLKRRNEDSPLHAETVQEIPADPAEKPKRKRNTIWSDILQDQLISEDLGSVLLKNKPANYGSRGHESYDYTLKYAESEKCKDLDCHMAEDGGSDSDKRSIRSFRSNKFYVKLDRTEEEAARKINKVIQEKKFYIICRVVKYLGIEKAVSLLKMTEEIEENGGMMIANHQRRRTAGGVYIQLLKSDKDVTKDVLDKIFEGEMSPLELKRHYKEKNMIRKKNKKLLKMKLESNLKPMPAGQEIESMDDTESLVPIKESSEDFILENNPPPSPVSVVPEEKNDSDLEDGEIED